MKKKIVFSLALCKKRYKKINSQRLEQCGQNKLNLLSTTVNSGNQEHTSLYTNKKSVRLTQKNPLDLQTLSLSLAFPPGLSSS